MPQRRDQTHSEGPPSPENDSELGNALRARLEVDAHHNPAEGRAADLGKPRDLRSRVGDGRGDELGRLAKAFDIMLDALATSVAAQRQLVADASHEPRG